MGRIESHSKLALDFALQVYKAREKATGRTVALKHMSLSEPGQLPKHVQRELQALEAIRHPNVVSLVTSHQKARWVGKWAAGGDG